MGAEIISSISFWFSRCEYKKENIRKNMKSLLIFFIISRGN
ncbi:hypothetical protein FH5_05488 [Priestia endophytica]|nr:hypothetical protein FH5_05488 [Priestia endophytica]